MSSPFEVAAKFRAKQVTQNELTDDLVLVLESVLAHVEDENAQRTGNQCTLCYTYRAMIREAINKARKGQQ